MFGLFFIGIISFSIVRGFLAGELFITVFLQRNFNKKTHGILSFIEFLALLTTVFSYNSSFWQLSAITIITGIAFFHICRDWVIYDSPFHNKSRELLLKWKNNPPGYFWVIVIIASFVALMFLS